MVPTDSDGILYSKLYSSLYSGLCSIVTQLKSERELSKVHFQDYAYDINIDPEHDDWHYEGLSRSIELLDGLLSEFKHIGPDGC